MESGFLPVQSKLLLLFGCYAVTVKVSEPLRCGLKWLEVFLENSFILENFVLE